MGALSIKILRSLANSVKEAPHEDQVRARPLGSWEANADSDLGFHPLRSTLNRFDGGFDLISKTARGRRLQLAQRGEGRRRTHLAQNPVLVQPNLESPPG
jgi:hypothetical protein